MIIDFAEEYKDLYEPIKDIPRRELRIYPTDQRGDDCGSYLGRKLLTDLEIFVLVQHAAPGGFLETEILSEKDVEKLRLIRKKIQEEPRWFECTINEIEHYLPFSYDNFKNLSLENKYIIIDRIKNEEGIGKIDFYSCGDEELIDNEHLKMIKK